MKFLSRSADQTHKLGYALGSALKSGDSVLLYGDLGAGKSVFARGCAKALGVQREMASPTFTLMQPYEGDGLTVYHFDLYRLSDPDELYFSGLEEHIGSDGVALIEWPQQGEVSPEPRAEVELRRAEDFDSRTIEITLIGMNDRADAIRRALEACACAPAEKEP